MKQGTQKFLIRTDQRIQFGKYGDTRRRKDKNTSKIPPEGMTSKDIRRMSEDELLDMDYFLNDDELDDDFGEEGFYIF